MKGYQMDETKPSLWQTIARLCKEHPLVGPIGVVGALASIIAIPLAIVFRIRPTVPKPELTYAIQPVRTAIVQVNRTSDIGVTYKRKPIHGDLTAAQIMIANAGKEPIEAKDVLVPITLVVSNAEILEYSFSTPPLAGTAFSLGANLPTNRLSMSWKVLEHGDNPVIQILYAGERNAPIMLEGRIQGQPALKEVKWPMSPLCTK